MKQKEIWLINLDPTIGARSKEGRILNIQLSRLG